MAYAGTKWGIKPHPAEHSDNGALKVDLDIRLQNTGIKLVVHIKEPGEYEMSFPGAGDSLADASANALEDAIPYVFGKIDKLLNPQSTTNAERVGGRSGGMATGLQAPGRQPLDAEVAIDTRSVANRNPEED